MKQSEFETAISKTRIKPGSKSWDAAKLILVDGLGSAAAAKKVGVVKSAAWQASETVKNSYLRESGAPFGWEVVTVIVPIESGAYERIKEIEREFIIKS